MLISSPLLASQNKNNKLAYTPKNTFYQIHSPRKTPLPHEQDKSQDNDKSFSGSAELLLWRNRTTGMQYAVTHTLAPTNPAYTIENQFVEYNIKPGFAPGFRFGLDYQLPDDQWEIAFVATSFAQNTAAPTLVKTPEIDIHIPYDQSGSMQPNTIDPSLFNSLTTLDFLISKKFEVDKYFTYSFTAGIKAAWVKEKETFQLVGTDAGIFVAGGPETATEIIKNYFKGVGLMAQCDGSWAIKGGVSIYGKLQGALLYGDTAIFQNEDLNLPPTALPPSFIQFSNHFDISSVKLNINTQLGLAWNFMLPDDKGCCCISGGYEFNYWPDQINLALFPLNTGGHAGGLVYTVPQNGDVSYQGLNFKVNLTYNF